jgi:hypothetical protein
MNSRFVEGVNGLRMHILEAGAPRNPTVLLLHGFPELSFSWRKVIPALAEAGYHVIAPDQRGYGRTTGWDPDYDGDLASFRPLNLVRDTLGLLDRLGIASTAAVVGHDFGATVAAWCALLRPDIFNRLVLMSAPFTGPPSLAPRAEDDIHRALSVLPRPRKHYQWYYSTREADKDMRLCPQGLRTFLRAYYHHKSGDWPGNDPHELTAWSAQELAKMPTYYIMDQDRTMAHSVEPPPPGHTCPWLTDPELDVYANAFASTGFQGALQWYRCRTQGVGLAEQQVFHGRKIEIPSLFIAGARDWGIHQTPGALDRMRTTACPGMQVHLVPGAGHWVQQEAGEAVSNHLLSFLNR